MGKKKKKKPEELCLYQVTVEYKAPMGFLMDDLFSVRHRRVQTMTVIAYTKKEATRRVIEQLIYVDRPYEITKVKRATKKSTDKKKRKHSNKMPSLLSLGKKQKKKNPFQKIRKVNIIEY